MLWQTLKFYLSSSWAYSTLLALACLVSCWLLLSLISILGMLRKSSSPSERNIRMSDFENSKQPSGDILPSLIVKISTVMIIMCVMVFALGAVSFTQKKQCTATGDFFESDHITVLSNEGSWFNVLAKDGRTYKFYPCPTSKMAWKSGTVIEYAKYEMRDGCADFSSPLASVIAH